MLDADRPQEHPAEVGNLERVAEGPTRKSALDALHQGEFGRLPALPLAHIRSIGIAAVALRNFLRKVGFHACG